MRKFIAALGGGLFGSLLVAAAVAAADPTPSPPAAHTTGTAAQVLGLSQSQIQALRHDGLSLAQIAERQKVALQTLIDALVARWQERIDARVQAGALTPAEAAALKAQLKTKAAEMVGSTQPGGMQGSAVGAGPQNGAGNGTQARDGTGNDPRGTGDGTCDGTGPHGAGRP